ncbi:MAG TPA: universal stress protein [Acidobacteriota bacterium]|nr:universal stress protein [Acidobacteriota bacterium]
MRHVLVPLDGSALAEAALPAAIATATAFGARLTLFHVLEEWAPETVHGQQHLTDAAQAEAYLVSVAQRPALRGHAVEVHVHCGRTENVADSIMAHADELAADLVVLSTHGQGGLKGFFLGSIALRALGRGRTPILMVNPTATGTPLPFVCRRILVPLDGSATHETALPVAERLARGWSAALHLVMVVPTARTLSGHKGAAGVLMPLATRAMLEIAEQDAAVYVGDLGRTLTAAGLVVTSSVGRGDPLTALLQTARTAEADLVVMATHARRAMEGFWAGSLTPKLMQRLDRPMLLVRAEGHDEAR